PNHPRVVFEVIEKIDHQFALISEAYVGALINVSDIDEDRVRILLTPVPNLRDATRQATTINCPVVIRCRQNMAVQIRRVQDRDADGFRLKRGSSTGQCRKCAEQSGSAGKPQEIASRPGSVWVRHCAVASADRLTVNESQFQLKRRASHAPWCLIVQKPGITVCVTILLLCSTKTLSPN